jgi:N-acetylglucosaminyldiphosphoundecaprenol N-acetyl-beta-D-mannosaminyltransferase
MNTKKILFNNTIYFTGGLNEFADFIFQKVILNKNNKTIITHINLRNYYYYQKDKELKEKIKESCFIIFEGIGMKIGFMLKGYGLLPDLNGTDLFPLLIKKIEGTRTGPFFLGSKENVIIQAVKNIQKEYPALNISGYNNGYFSADEEPGIIEKINKSKANILFVGMGFPLQEKFIIKNIDKINPNLIWNVGGLFDILSGYKPRAPRFFRKMRLEWLFRLMLEPRRMLHRNFIAAPWSLAHIIFNAKKN